MEKPISVFACEPQPIVIEGLQKVLESAPDFVFAGAAPGPEETIAAISDLAAQVILYSQVPGLPPEPQAVAEIRSAAESSRLILWVADLDTEEFYRCFQLGFCGIVRKTRPVASLLECLRAVGHGSVWAEKPSEEAAAPVEYRRKAPRLTARERQIAQLAATGLRNRDIAEELAISPGTVKVHLMHIFEKLAVEDRFQLALQARRFLSADQPPAGSAPPPLANAGV